MDLRHYGAHNVSRAMRVVTYKRACSRIMMVPPPPIRLFEQIGFQC